MILSKFDCSDKKTTPFKHTIRIILNTYYVFEKYQNLYLKILNVMTEWECNLIFLSKHLRHAFCLKCAVGF